MSDQIGLPSERETASTPREQTIAAATAWLRTQCHDYIAPDEIHAAAVKIANIVLRLRVTEAQSRIDHPVIQGLEMDAELQQIVADAIAEVGGQSVSRLNAYRVMLALRDRGAQVVYAASTAPSGETSIGETAVVDPAASETPVSAQKVIAFCDRQLGALAALEAVRTELKSMRRAAQASIVRGSIR